VVGYSDILGDDVRQKADRQAGGTIAVDAKDVLNDLRIITENAMRCQKIIENLLLFVRQGEIEKKARRFGQGRAVLPGAASIQIEESRPHPGGRGFPRTRARASAATSNKFSRCS
jgi:hypothetical protein